MFFTNKHVVAALIIAPILSVIAYFAVDNIVSEKPHQAKKGAEYVLLAKPNCRYSSGKCGFKNGNFELEVRLEPHDTGVALMLDSQFPLVGGKVSLQEPDQENVPIALTAADETGKLWSAQFEHHYQEDDVLRLVVSSQDSLYYGETVAAFGHYETSYGADYRQ